MMIKICKYIYISPLTAVFFVVCFLFEKTPFFIISYTSMLFHELGHLTAALLIGLKISHVSLHPFGVNLRLDSKFVCSVWDDIILYLSGPFVNIILALLFTTVLKGKYLYDYGFMVNIMLFIMNLLPVSPLDGGSLLKKILVLKIGERRATLIMNTMTVFLSVIFFALGIYVVYKTEYNFSCALLGILMFANVFVGKEMYSETAIRNLIFDTELKRDKTGRPICFYASYNELVPTEFVKFICPNKFLCVAEIGDNGKIKKITTEKEILFSAHEYYKNNNHIHSVNDNN